MPEPKEQQPKESARDLIQQIADHTQEADNVEFKKATPGRVRRGLIASAILLAGAYLAWDIYQRPEPEPVFDEPALAAGLEFTVYLTVSGIEEFRQRTGALPETLEAAGLDDPSIRYETGRGGYRVEAVNSAHSIVFNEGDDLEPLKASFWTLQRRGSG